MIEGQSSRRRILIAVTHLLGVGHFARMAALARALAKSGQEVMLISGGRAVPTISTDGATLVQLPAVHCRGTDFATLYADDGSIASVAQLEARASAMQAHATAFKPEVAIVELYPFGRNVLRAEFSALVETCHALVPRPAILCSIRDVLNPSTKPGRAEMVLERLVARFDGILVHGDPMLLPLEASWPVSPQLARRIAYTGYLRDSARTAARDTVRLVARRGILVSAGGSEAGEKLARSAIGAAALLPDLPWHILIGQGVPRGVFEELQADLPVNCSVERARPDFPQLLEQAALSVSQAGYNTVLDLASAGTRAVLVPFAAGNEQEQTIRAKALAEKGLAVVISEDALSADRLASAVLDGINAPEADWSAVRRDGDEGSVRLVLQAGERAHARALAWKRLEAALARVQQVGQRLDFWIRDDDAVEANADLERFLALLDRFALPASLAAIPFGAHASLAARLRSEDRIDVLVHGFAHRNHAPSGEKAAEFGDHRPLDQIRADLAFGIEHLAAIFGPRMHPIFVPPWNRISTKVSEALSPLGYRVLSTFARRKRDIAPPGLVLANTHWDPIAWRMGGGLKDEAGLLNELTVLVDETRQMPATEREVIGLLTHHRVHDGWIDRFLAEVLACLAMSGVCRFVTARSFIRSV